MDKTTGKNGIECSKKINYFKKKLDKVPKKVVAYSMVKKDKKMNDNKCSKCGKIPAKIEYKNKQYCTWYCAKKDK